MNPRQRILAAVLRQPVDRIPTDIWATPEVQRILQDYCGCDSFVQTWDHLGIDGIVDVKPDYVGPTLPDVGPDRQIDEWGIVRKWQAHSTGGYWEYDAHPLAQAQTIADLDAYAWPRPEWYDFPCSRQGRRAPGTRHHVRLHRHLLLSQPAARAGAVAHGPDPAPGVHRPFVRRLSETFFDLHQAGFEAAGDVVDIAQVTDDFGSQRGLLISRGMFEAFYRPWMERGIDLVKSHDILVFHHDDGAIRSSIPDFIDMGIDVLNPVQWRCQGMEQAGLARDFGRTSLLSRRRGQPTHAALRHAGGGARRGGVQPAHAGQGRHGLHRRAVPQHPAEHAA